MLNIRNAFFSVFLITRFFRLLSIFRHVFCFLYDIIGSQRNIKAISCDRKEQNMMKITIMRQIDTLGRIVIPKDLRDQYGIKKGNKIYFDACDDGILIYSESYKYNDEMRDDKKER